MFKVSTSNSDPKYKKTVQVIRKNDSCVSQIIPYDSYINQIIPYDSYINQMISYAWKNYNQTKAVFCSN